MVHAQLPSEPQPGSLETLILVNSHSSGSLRIFRVRMDGANLGKHAHRSPKRWWLNPEDLSTFHHDDRPPELEFRADFVAATITGRPHPHHGEYTGLPLEDYHHEVGAPRLEGDADAPRSNVPHACAALVYPGETGDHDVGNKAPSALGGKFTDPLAGR